MWDLIVSVPDHCLYFYFDPFLVATQCRMECSITELLTTRLYLNRLSNCLDNIYYWHNALYI